MCLDIVRTIRTHKKLSLQRSTWLGVTFFFQSRWHFGTSTYPIPNPPLPQSQKPHQRKKKRTPPPPKLLRGKKGIVYTPARNHHTSRCSKFEMAWDKVDTIRIRAHTTVVSHPFGGGRRRNSEWIPSGSLSKNHKTIHPTRNPTQNVFSVFQKQTATVPGWNPGPTGTSQERRSPTTRFGFF